MTGKFASIVLASSSAYRQKQLKQLGLPFISAAPSVDESPLDGETARALAIRLSRDKALSLQAQYPEAIIIGSDQTAEVDNHLLGKPLTRENAIDQLTQCQGKSVQFYSGLCVINGSGFDENAPDKTAVVETRVTFRPLTPEQIQNYIDRDLPLNCAGSFKCESLGISLFSAIESTDPTALIGLPLICLNLMLLECGVDTLA